MVSKLSSFIATERHHDKESQQQQTIPLLAVVSSPSELDYPMTEEDVVMAQEFEAAWADFLEVKDGKPAVTLPMGKRGERVAGLMGRLNETLQSKAAVESELTTQLDLLQVSRNILEDAYQTALKEERRRRKVGEERLQRQLDNVAIAEHTGSTIIAWDHFLESVDQAIVPEERKGVQKSDTGVKPSARAMALVDPIGDARDIEIRAFRIDNALLQTQVSMLETEVQYYESATESLEDVGNLLTENNIWSILTQTS